MAATRPLISMFQKSTEPFSQSVGSKATPTSTARAAAAQRLEHPVDAGLGVDAGHLDEALDGWIVVDVGTVGCENTVVAVDGVGVEGDVGDDAQVLRQQGQVADLGSHGVEEGTARALHPAAVGGGIVAVVPGKYAIAAFSPRLNEAGNSIRSMKAIRYIAGELGAGLYGPNPE